MIDLSLLEDFIEGAAESLDEMEAALLELETSPDDKELLNVIFRAMHTIKGAAQFVGLEKVSALSHALEDLLDLLREGKKQATLEIIDILIQAKDRISMLSNDLEKTQTENTEVDDLIEKLQVHLSVEPVVSEDQPIIEEDEGEDISPFLSETDEGEDIASFLSEEDESEDVSSFLSETDEGEDIASFLSEEDESEDVSSFLSETDEGENISSFLSEEDEGEDVSSFLSETDEGEDIASFLSEEDEGEDVSSFLSETDEGEDISSFLSEEDESEDVSSFLLEEPSLLASIEENTQADELSVSSSINDDFIVPEEEYDEELFGIFILQLQEKFSELIHYMTQLETVDNKNALLHSIIAVLENLKFSANYMAYDKLTHIYGRWIDEALDAQEDYGVTGTISFDFMDDYLLKLRNIFPQLKDVGATVETIDENIEDDLSQAIVNALDGKIEEDAALAFIGDLVTQDEKVVDVFAPSDVDENLPEEGDLFDKLSLAFDASMIEQSITSEPINEVFSTLLETTEKQKNKVNDKKEKDLTLEVKTLTEINNEPPQQPEASVNELKSKDKVDDVVKESIKPKLQKEKAIDDKTKKSVVASSDKVFRKSIRVDADKIDSLMNQVGELIVDRAYFFQLAIEIGELQQYLREKTGLGQKDLKPVRTFAYRFSEAIISLGRTSNELQEGVMKVRMLPIAQIFNRYPRLVHDVAHTNNKKVQLEIRGEDTELDKMIIEEISDPLIHMIRNAIGHGIELPEDRVKAGKPETGTLILEAFHESNHIVIEVTDDGKGIDTGRIKAKAEAMKLFSKDELDRMSDKELTRFIMMPGFSTAKSVDSTSGRGVGMDVVKKNIEKLNGAIEVESKKGVETKVRLKIPLTLAIIQALLVRVGIDSFTIPLANVEETLKVFDSDITIMEDTEVMYLRGKTIPIFRLAVLFNLKSDSHKNNSDFFVVIVNTGTQKIGLMVDALIGQEEVVIKPLADYLHEKNCFSGATIIGDGRISLILDVHELVNMTTDRQIKKHHNQERKSLVSLGN